MMIYWMFTVFLLVSNAEPLIRSKKSEDRCWTSGNNQAAQWWDEGSDIIRGKYFYTCLNGILKPKGCIVNETFRVEINESYVDGRYEIQCVISKNNHLYFKFLSCVSNDGRKFKAGETWDDPEKTYWFICQPDEQYLKETIGGCVSHDKTSRIKLGEQIDYGNFTYKCSLKSDGVVSMCSVGCIHNGAHYEIGEQWPDGEYIYYCKKFGSRTQKVYIGCQHNGKSFYDGDRFHKGNTIIECEVRLNSYAQRPVGCVFTDQNGTTVERIIGCRWHQKIGNAKVERSCVLTADKKTSEIQSLGCIYEQKNYDSLFIYPNSYTIWMGAEKKVVVVACKEDLISGNLYVEAFGPEKIAQKTVGLQYDMPHGVR